MKWTTTIEEIITSELQRKGFSEFYQCNQNLLTWNNDIYTFISKIQSFDKDVKSVVDAVIFSNIQYPQITQPVDPQNLETFDIWIKKTFINKFLDRQIKWQTIDLFRSKLLSFMSLNGMQIQYLYENFSNFMSGKGLAIHENRIATQDLPQTQVNIDLNDDSFPFASSNNISKDSNNSTNYNIDTLMKSLPIFQQFFDEMEDSLFLVYY
jgi:hypothetical protein